MAIEFEDRTKDPPKKKAPIKLDVEAGVNQLMEAFSETSIMCFYQDPLHSYNATEKVICLLTALRRGFNNCLDDAIEGGLLLGVNPDSGNFMVPKDSEDIDEGIDE